MGTLGRGWILCLLGVAAWGAEVSLTAPALGSIRDCQGRTRDVFGSPGAFVLGTPRAEQNAALPEPVEAKIEGRDLILTRPDATEKRIQLPAPVMHLQTMGRGWLAALPFAIRLTPDGAIVYRLPMKACAAEGRP